MTTPVMPSERARVRMADMTLRETCCLVGEGIGEDHKCASDRQDVRLIQDLPPPTSHLTKVALINYLNALLCVVGGLATDQK